MCYVNYGSGLPCEDSLTCAMIMAEEQSGPIPFWNMNIPRQKWTQECPEYLKSVDSSDREQLGRNDAEYKLMSWQEASSIVSKLRLADPMR